MIGTRKRARLALGLVGLAAALGVAASGQEPTGALLRISGRVESPVKFSGTDLAGMPRTRVQATDHGGVRSEYEGVSLMEILRKAGAPIGKRSKGGKGAACYVVVEASDGYRAIFALAELDPDFTDKAVLLADRRDGRPLAGPVGPLRLIVPDDKRPARWVRLVESVAVRQAARTNPSR